MNKLKEAPKPSKQVSTSPLVGRTRRHPPSPPPSPNGPILTPIYTTQMRIICQDGGWNAIIVLEQSQSYLLPHPSNTQGKGAVH
ncbi:hypothetical protein Pcinc_009727 [Petrolisthes cinctipes]|uniref:Uncharacterized protein n=1 Tax=Petrolisthes cinctipes TaxID=88211 RepID=A0AAE1KY68_PETCI|nr:hypothetical protein Pcinc_009727 [Petrolisthes cinctipes]